MKQLIAISITFFCFAACRKEASFTADAPVYLRQVQTTLKDSLFPDMAKLDFNRAVRSTINSDTSYLRVPYAGKAIAQEFVLLQTDNVGRVKKGKIIALSAFPSRKPDMAFDGVMVLRHLNGTFQLQSEIADGYVLEFRRAPLLRTGIASRDIKTTLSHGASAYKVLPEVIVVGHRQAEGVSYSDWLNLQSLADGGGGGSGVGAGYSTSGYYSSADGNGGSGGNGDDSNDRTRDERERRNNPVEDRPILIDFENQDANPPIDIEAYLKCFEAIPDAGATCSIEILTDIPVDDDSKKFFNWDTRAPGHTFIKLNKRNGTESVQQVLGWYPEEGYKLLLSTAPTSGKFVDNGRHEFNATLTMSITPVQLRGAITHILYLKGFIKYDVDGYNCTDFALQIFNETVSPYDRLEIMKYDLPGSTNPFGSNTPNGLYEKLKSLQQGNGTVATDVNIPEVKGWVGNSHGPCK